MNTITENQSESPHERRITWSLIALVVGFVLIMTCVVLWITSSLIRNELGETSNGDPTSEPSTVTVMMPSATSETSETPELIDATLTPLPEDPEYVKFVYWFVKPNQIVVGECVQITWEIENAVSLELYRNGELILEDAALSQTFKDCPTQLGYNVYRMVGENSVGQSNWIQLQVRVKEAH